MKPQLIIIGTTHEEIGQTTVDDLYNLILKIKPEAIFEEIPVDLFDKIYETDELPETIEVKAVKRYSTTHTVKHFPIDLNNLGRISMELGTSGIDEKIASFIKQNKKMDIITLNTKLNALDSMGHNYINSKEHYNLYTKIKKLTEQYLKKHNQELYLKKMIDNTFHFGIREYNMLLELDKSIHGYNKSLLCNRLLSS